MVGADQSEPLLEPDDHDEADAERYGQAKVACEQASAAVAGGPLLIARAGEIRWPRRSHRAIRLLGGAGRA